MYKVKKPDLSKVEGFEWNNGNLNHIKRHEVECNECEEVFSNKPLIVLFDEAHSVSENRFKVFGISSRGRKLILAVTVRKEKIRVVTARDQNKKEKTDLMEVKE